MKDLIKQLRDYKPTEVSYSLINVVKEAGVQEIPFTPIESTRPLLKLSNALRQRANEEQNNNIKKAYYMIEAAKGLLVLKEKLHE